MSDAKMLSREAVIAIVSIRKFAVPLTRSEANKILESDQLQRDRITELLRVCWEAYQLAGAVGAPAKALDNLSYAAQGAPLPHKTFLPLGPQDFSGITELEGRLSRLDQDVKIAIGSTPGGREALGSLLDAAPFDAPAALNRYAVWARETINRLVGERDVARAERDRARVMETRNYLASPAMRTFVDLKHSQAGTVLAMLGDGAISRGKCCEVLAQLAHGVPFDEIPLPEEKGRQFSEDEIPAEVVEKLEAELAALRLRLEEAEKERDRLAEHWVSRSGKLPASGSVDASKAGCVASRAAIEAEKEKV